MKIFAYYKNKIHELEVAEAKSMYISKDGSTPLAFGYANHFKKSDMWATTPLGAVLRESRKKLSLRFSLEEKIHDINSELNILKKMAYLYL